MKYSNYWIERKLDDPNNDRVNVVVDDIKTMLRDLSDITGYPEKISPIETLIISVGGDGTAISAMKIGAYYDADVMCVNLGRIGFLADYHPQRVIEYFQSMMQDNVSKVEYRSLLNADHIDGPILAVNDFVISRLFADEMLEYELFVDGSYAGAHRANGVIISTPTGSTAYALAAGGAILHPTVECVEIVPIAAATMTSRPIIVSSKSEILVKIDLTKLRGSSKQVVVRADGQVTPAGFQDDTDLYTKTLKVNISTFEKKARILHQAHWNFFDVLTEKLNWNK